MLGVSVYNRELSEMCGARCIVLLSKDTLTEPKWIRNQSSSHTYIYICVIYMYSEPIQCNVLAQATELVQTLAYPTSR